MNTTFKGTPGKHYAVEYAGYWNIQSEPYYDSENNLLDAEYVGAEAAEANAKLYACALEMFALLDALSGRVLFNERYPETANVIKQLIQKATI